MLVPMLKDGMLCEEVLQVLLKLSEQPQFKNVFYAAGVEAHGAGLAGKKKTPPMLGSPKTWCLARGPLAFTQGTMLPTTAAQLGTCLRS
jgi:hypothetical protein